MVKEVEFSNVSEVLDSAQQYSNSGDQKLFDGYLSDEGLTLNIKVKAPLLPEIFAKRKLFLYFNNIDFSNNLSEYISLGETDPDYCNKDVGKFTDKEYVFDISSVLTIPRKVYSTGGTSEITIELYTYEANLSTDYGTKTLSVPYSITSNQEYSYDKSTDGVYKLITADFEPWVDTRVYGVGDIIMSADTLMVSKVSDNSDIITEDSWSVPENIDITNYCHGTTKWPPLRAFITDILISRYAKYGIMKDILVSTGFKSYDDETSYELLLLLQNLREQAKFKLIGHTPIDAAYSLEMLKLTSSKSTDTTKVNTYNIKYTT